MESNRNGQINLNTVLGAIGTAGATGLLNGMNLFGGRNCSGNCDGAPVTKSEMHLIQENNALSNENALLKADKYTDQKFADLNDRYNERFRNIESQIAVQAVHNAKTEGSFALVHEDIKAVRNELMGAVEREAERRCCADNAIVNYANATFYPKLVADVTAGTTTTAQTLYNPIPNCKPCC